MEPDNRFDISNIRFGKLTAVQPVSGKNSTAVWLCKCDCGQEKLVTYHNLAYGKTKSCGCSRSFKQASELTGQRFGRLIAQERLPDKKHRSFLWRCLCDCGAETVVPATALRKGQIRSCGCLARDTKRSFASNLKGMRFGRLTAIEPTEERSLNGGVIWRCKCDCGNETFQISSVLLGGNVLSCGCKRQENDSLKRSMDYIDGTCVQFLKQTEKLRSDNTSGVRGVSPHNGKWRARITFKKKTYYLGEFNDIEQAIEIRKKAENLLYGEFLDWYNATFPKKDGSSTVASEGETQVPNCDGSTD